MANVKISELPLTLSVSPTALIPVVQNGTTCSTYACLIGGSSASGTSGTSGAAGAPGAAGTSGAAGAPGAPGTSGTSGGFGAVIIAGSGECSSVRDGVSNVASGNYSFAGGGSNNTACSNTSVIVGGGSNTACGGTASFIGGGILNQVRGDLSAVVGGLDNCASANFSFVGGGNNNGILAASTITCTFPVTANTVNSFDLTGNVSNFFPSTATPVTPPAIGDSYGGGQVAYILQPGDPGYDANFIKGIISAVNDQSTGIRWYNGDYTTTGATGTAIGTGKENSDLIKAVQGVVFVDYAAGLAESVTDGGYSDWYLPSKNELAKLYAMKLLGFGGFADNYYWSSSEVDSYDAWSQSFTNGEQNFALKSSTYYVRAIRSFSIAANTYAGTDLVEATFRGTAGTSGVTLTDWGANFSYPTTYLTGNENIGAGPYDNVVLSFTDFGGEKSTIVGGQNNKVDGAYSFVGGAGGTVSSFGTSGSNTICQNADYSFIGAGGCNTIKPCGNVLSINQLSFVYSGSAGNYTCNSLQPSTTSGVGTGLYANVSFCSNVPVSVTPAMSGSGFKIGDTVTFEIPDVTPTTPAIGSSYGGGKVAYILVDGDPGYDANYIKGLIAQDADISRGTDWGCDGTDITTSSILGTGNANTIAIMDGCPTAGIAARLCGDSSEGGYSDWYLPSLDELSQLYINRVAIGGFDLGTFGNAYWSSTQADTNNAQTVEFNLGAINAFGKSFNLPFVRAIRSFSIPLVAYNNLTATIYEIDTVKNNAILGGFKNTIACASNAGVFGCCLTNTQSNTFMANNFIVGDLAGNAGCFVSLDLAGKLAASPAPSSPIVVGNGVASLLGNSSQGNLANGDCSAVYGGIFNCATCNYSSILAGACNRSTGFISAVVGGISNNSSSDFTFVGGGSGNSARKGNDTVVGGSGNSTDSSIGGYSFIGGGNSHQTLSMNSAILGGGNNRICYGAYNTIAGGCCNKIQGGYQTVANFDFIGGGCSNTINHFSFGPSYCPGYSAILGGFGNTVTGNYTAAFGCMLTASANNTFYVNDMCVCGTLYKTAGSFKISHPDPIKEQAGETLRHSFVESATAGDNIYRYSVTTSNGVATLELPDYYKFLNENDQVWVSPVGHFGSAYGVVNADQTAVDLVSNADGEYNVLIIGTRKDKAAVDAWAGINS